MDINIDLNAVLVAHRAWWNSEEGGRRADLRGADLSGADLSRADLSRADLSDTTINWSSHTLIGELLWRSATTVEQRMVAAFIARQTYWCWKDFLALKHAETAWALDELRGWVQDGDGAPAILCRQEAR